VSLRIAVTGASGRIGRAVVDLAAQQGHTVVAIDRAGDGVRCADVTVYEQLAAAAEDCDALIHLAAHSRPGQRPDHVTHNENVTGSYNALQVAANLGIDRVCLASSVNAIGGGYSRRPRFDYFPIDERHPTYNEDPYSLSKWIGEAQADSVARRNPHMSIASLRLHAVRATRPTAIDSARSEFAIRDLWGYVPLRAAARACVLALTADFRGHEVFYIVAPDTAAATPTAELCQKHYPDVPLRRPLPDNTGLYDCGKAERVLGWTATRYR